MKDIDLPIVTTGLEEVQNHIVKRELKLWNLALWGWSLLCVSGPYFINLWKKDSLPMTLACEKQMRLYVYVKSWKL